MKKFFIICSLFFSVGCSPISTMLSPATIANSTIIDEQAATGIELAYKTFNIAAQTAVNAGLINRETAPKLADIDNRLYAAVQIERTAYKAANASDFNGAVIQIESLITQGDTLIGAK